VTTPFDSVRDAVAGYAASAASTATAGGTATGAPVGTGATFAGSEPAVGVYDALLGKLVARYPAVGYDRSLEAIAVTCDESVPVHLYVGSITPASRLTSYGDGSLSDYAPPIPRIVPQGAPLIVVWDVTLSTSDGVANAQLRSV
jgi:hypothetical protein